MRITLAWGLALAGTACALNPPPVPVTGSPHERSTLEGEWIGEYRSVETGRSGSIWFKLDAGRDTALGDIIMVPLNASPIRTQPTVAESPVTMHPQPLSIRFVHVSGNSVIGTIDLYQSPDCGCVLITRFAGELTRDSIAGTFTSAHSGHEMAPQKGTWWVKRKVKP